MRNKENRMNTQKERAILLKNLHVKGDPLILFNIWDAGSAKAIQEMGSKVIATSSWSVAAAHGFDDGANGFFAPGLSDAHYIEKLCKLLPIPVNMMVLPDRHTSKQLAELGVARISYGPSPYFQMITALKESGCR